MFNRKQSVVRTKKYGKLIRISVIFAVIAISAGFIAYGWQHYEESKYPEGTEMDYSLPNAFINFARLINEFMTQNQDEEPETKVPIEEPEEEDDIIIVVGKKEEEEESSENVSEPEEPSEPEIRGGIAPESENTGYYSFKNTLFVGDYFISQINSLGFFDKSAFVYTTTLDMNTLLTKKEHKLGEEYVTMTDYIYAFDNVEAIYVVFSAESVSWMDCPTFVKKYSAFIDEIIDAHPDAHIYVQPILPINEEKAAKRGYSVTNKRINEINGYIFEIAEEKNLWILDMVSVFAGEDGELPEHYTTNGIRFETDAYQLWNDYVVTHKAH